MTATELDTPVQALINTAAAGDVGTLMQVPFTIISLVTSLFVDEDEVVNLYVRTLHVGDQSMKIKAEAVFHLRNIF